MKRSIFISAILIVLMSATGFVAAEQNRDIADQDTTIQYRRGWEKLGETRVDRGRGADRDTIHVGRDEGRFREIMFKVQDNDILLFDVVVTFANGETFSPQTRLHFDEDSRSRAIDLPGRARFIRNVKFSYRNIGRGRATVELYAR